MGYQRNFGSKFPESLITAGGHLDIDDSVINIINQYNAYLNDGDVASAVELYNTNKSTMDKYIINSAYINFLEEELHNTGLMALSYQTSLISDVEPEVAQTEGSVWRKEIY